MNSIELKQILIEMYGKEYGSGRKLSDDIGINEVTISRWLTGFSPISKSMAIFIRLIHYLDTHKIPWRKKIIHNNNNSRKRQSNKDL